MAKGLGGGMPIGAICATAEVAKAFTRDLTELPSAAIQSAVQQHWQKSTN